MTRDKEVMVRFNEAEWKIVSALITRSGKEPAVWVRETCLAQQLTDLVKRLAAITIAQLDSELTLEDAHDLIDQYTVKE